MKNIASYDVVSKYYSYAVEYYKDTDDEIQWLPICAIPQTIIANKTLFAIALSQIADNGEFFETKADYAKDMVTGFIRLKRRYSRCCCKQKRSI